MELTHSEAGCVTAFGCAPIHSPVYHGSRERCPGSRAPPSLLWHTCRQEAHAMPDVMATMHVSQAQFEDKRVCYALLGRSTHAACARTVGTHKECARTLLHGMCVV